MSTKTEYDAMQAAKHRSRAAEASAWEAEQRRRKVADEAITLLLVSLSDWLEGRAAIIVGNDPGTMATRVTFRPVPKPEQKNA